MVSMVPESISYVYVVIGDDVITVDAQIYMTFNVKYTVDEV
jgi:hypothetical protein